LDYTEKSDKPQFEWASLTINVFTPFALFEALEANIKEDSHEFGRDIIPFLLAGNYRYTVISIMVTGVYPNSRGILADEHGPPG